MRVQEHVSAETHDRQVTLDVLDEVFGRADPGDFAVRLWDGTEWRPLLPVAPRFTLALAHPGALRAMFVPPTELTIGEAYVRGDFDIEGDIEAAMRVAVRLLEQARPSRATLARIGSKLLTLPGRERIASGRGPAHVRGAQHSKERDRQAIAYHYDVGNDFYGLFLDRDLVYSCAYFDRPDEGIDDAQRRKLDYICRKLRLAPGDRLLDVGCGWGALVRHAAREYGADAVGVTLSERQAELARERISAEGLGERCRIQLADYRDVGEGLPFDKLVSVGMFEHVGAAKLPEYFAKAFRLLRPGGVFLNHGIACRSGGAMERGSFSNRYVFPDGELEPVSESLRVAERAGFEVRDVEDLREHYALTLREWVRRLESHADEARAAADEATYRTWRLFMAASAHGFATDALQVYQALLLKPDGGETGMPLTRADWYA